jgi:prevent-host-death family protein
VRWLLVRWVLASGDGQAYRRQQQASVDGEEADMYYTDDSDQLPELPDPGPRDGRHGVDKDGEYDPYPGLRMGVDTLRGALAVSLEDAKVHLGLLVQRVESGEEILLTRNGHPVARIAALASTPHAAPPSLRISETVVESVSVSRPVAGGPVSTERTIVDTVTAVVSDGTESEPEAAIVVIEEDDQLPELPDPGPRDGRHGVDREVQREIDRESRSPFST